jgi:DNA polymerase III gamma/tau subunit
MSIASQLVEKIDEAVSVQDLNKLLKKNHVNQTDKLLKIARAVLKRTNHPLAVLNDMTTPEAESIIKQFGTPQDKKMYL